MAVPVQDKVQLVSLDITNGLVVYLVERVTLSINGAQLNFWHRSLWYATSSITTAPICWRPTEAYVFFLKFFPVITPSLECGAGIMRA